MSSVITGILNFATRLLARLPLPAALALGRGAGWFYGSVMRYHRRSALEALARAFPERSGGEIRGCTRTSG